MPRQVSRGTCNFCQKETSKPTMRRHLENCEQRAAVQAQEKPRRLLKSKAFHVLVEGYRLPMYWMHLEIVDYITLARLDRFLRDTWVECCGHLSVFRINGLNYYVDGDIDTFYDWDGKRRDMQARMDKVLSPGLTFSYEYDFGSTTELTLKVISEREAAGNAKPIQVLARNNLPLIPCDVCGNPSTHICGACIYKDEGCLCDECARKHQCREGFILPRANSPREGVCGYTGHDSAYTF